MTVRRLFGTSMPDLDVTLPGGLRSGAVAGQSQRLIPTMHVNGAAVEFYLNARREEMQAGMRELLSQLDGSRAARVALLAGMTREELEAVGGVEEDD